MSKGYKQISVLFVLGMLLAACSQNDSSSALSEGSRTIYGTSQKGPFVKGTEVTLYGMDEGLIQTGTHFSTEIDNNRGEYTLEKINLENRYAWLVANGYYIDEMTGDTSTQKISLNSLVDLQNRDQVNINVLTHLSFDRIRYLVKQGQSVVGAKRQAEIEVMAAFGFSELAESFDQLDILGSAEGDAKLLAISVMVLTAANVGDVTSRMARIAMDLEKDGSWDDTTLIQQIKGLVSMANHDGVYKKVKENLVKLGATDIPDFQKYLDKFASPWDSTWEHCSNENEVKRTTHFNDSLYGRVICRDGIWKYYRGPRDEGDAPVDTTGKYGTFVDERDGHVYKTLDVKMESGRIATWMASLLEYEPPSGVKKEARYVPGVGREYYGNQALGYPYGMSLYGTEEDVEIANKMLFYEFIQGICPDGWHLPYYEEWNYLWNVIKDDYATRELFVYQQYTDSGAKKSLDKKHGYYVDFEYSFELTQEGEFAYRVRNIWNWNADDAKVHISEYYPIRCVKDWERK